VQSSEKHLMAPQEVEEASPPKKHTQITSPANTPVANLSPSVSATESGWIVSQQASPVTKDAAVASSYPERASSWKVSPSPSRPSSQRGAVALSPNPNYIEESL